MSKLAVSIQKGALAHGGYLSDDIATLVAEQIAEGYVLIPKADLPAIELCGCSPDGLYMNEECWSEGMANTPVDVAWEKVLEYAAHWNFIASGKAKRILDEESRNRRRNELAKEFYGHSYPITPNNAQGLINRIIELEESK